MTSATRPPRSHPDRPGRRRPRRGLPVPADHRRDPGDQRRRRESDPRHDRRQGPARDRRAPAPDRAPRPRQSERRGRLRHGPPRHPGQGRRPAALPAPRRDEERLRDRHHDEHRHARQDDRRVEEVRRHGLQDAQGQGRARSRRGLRPSRGHPPRRRPQGGHPHRRQPGLDRAPGDLRPAQDGAAGHRVLRTARPGLGHGRHEGRPRPEPDLDHGRRVPVRPGRRRSSSSGPRPATPSTSRS